MALKSPSDILSSAKYKAETATAAKKASSAAAAAAAKKNAANAAAAKKAADASRAKAATDAALKSSKAAADKAARDALRQKLTGGLLASTEATSLYVDPTPAYQPALDFLKTQTKAANDRYKVNKENISNIFGDLAGLAAKDSVRIRDQFTASIANQQMGLSNRTAEVRKETAAGQAQVAATGAERGQGPAMANSPVAEAAEQGIARSNEYQTTWQALQEANQQQAQTDITARGAGYSQQEVGAIQQLTQNLEDKLVQLAGNTAGVQSDIAAAKVAGQQQVAQANYGEIQTAKQQQAALAEERVRANARISAANASAAARANKPKTYANNLTGWTSQVNDSKIPNIKAANIVATVSAIKGQVSAALKASKSKNTAATKSLVIDELSAQYGEAPWLTLAIDYVNRYSGLRS